MEVLWDGDGVTPVNRQTPVETVPHPSDAGGNKAVKVLATYNRMEYQCRLIVLTRWHHHDNDCLQTPCNLDGHNWQSMSA